METALLYFIFNIASVLLTEVAKDFGEHVLQRVVGDGTTMLARRRNGVVTVVTDVESGTETMTALVGGISIATKQALHVFLGTKDAGDDDAMERNTLDCKGIEIVATNVLQEHGCTGNEVGNAVRHTPVHNEVGIAAHIDEFRLAVFCLLTIENWTHAPLTGRHYLHVLHIGKAVLIAVDTADGMIF